MSADSIHVINYYKQSFGTSRNALAMILSDRERQFREHLKTLRSPTLPRHVNEASAMKPSGCCDCSIERKRACIIIMVQPHAAHSFEHYLQWKTAGMILARVAELAAMHRISVPHE